MSAAPAAAAAPACTTCALKPSQMFGGGVLKKQASGLTDLFDGAAAADKIRAVSKSSHGEHFKLELAGERAHCAPKKGAQVENSAKLSFSQRSVSLDVEGKASGSASAGVTIQDALVKGVTAKASADFVIGDKATTVRSGVDYKTDLLTASAGFEYPLGGSFQADVSLVAKKSGVSAGGRVVSTVAAGGVVGVSDYEVAVGYQRDAVQIAAAVTDKASRVSAGVAVDVKEKTRLAAAVSLDRNSNFKPTAVVGGSFQVDPKHRLRATATIPTGDVALILASQIHADLKTTLTGSFCGSTKRMSVGLGVELSHSD